MSPKEVSFLPENVGRSRAPSAGRSSSRRSRRTDMWTRLAQDRLGSLRRRTAWSVPLCVTV